MCGIEGRKEEVEQRVEGVVSVGNRRKEEGGGNNKV